MKKLYEEFEKLSGKFEEGVYYGQYNKDIEFLTAYHTSVLRENLINWYPISKEDSILVISSGLGALIPYLCKNAGTVTVLESSSANCYAIEKRCINFPNIILHNIDFMEFKTLARFDYIIAIDYFIKFQATFLGQYTIIDFLEKASLYLSETGKLLLACNNKMGLKYFNGAFPNISNTSLFDSFNNINFFSKAELESAFNVCGFKKYKFYYPFPDYAFPRSIFTDDSIKELEFGHHYNDYPLDRYQFFDEFKMYHELQKNGVVNIFSNSFLIELSNDMHYDNEIIFAKNQYFIDKKHKAATILYKGTLKLAEKKSLTKESAEYLKKLYDDSLILNRGEHCFKYIKYSFDESKHILKMPYIDGPSISNELEEKLVLLLKTEKECYKKDILRIFKGIYTKMLTEAVIVSPTQIFCKEFRDIFGDETIDQELYCLNPVTLDLHVDHIYRKEDDYEVIDIDPIKFLNVPVQYLIWCIIESWHYTYIFKNSQAELLIDIENIYANFGITEGMLTVFKEWRNNVYKNELAVSQIQPFYSQTYQPSFLAYKDINKFGIHSNNDSRVMAAMKRNLTVNYQITKLSL